MSRTVNVILLGLLVSACSGRTAGEQGGEQGHAERLGTAVAGLLPPAQVTLTPVAIGFNNPISVDYFAPTNEVILSTNYPNGSPYNFELVSSTGVRTQFTSIAGLTDEVYIAAVRTAHAGFAAGDFFTGTGVAGQIARVTNNGPRRRFPGSRSPVSPACCAGPSISTRPGCSTATSSSPPRRAICGVSIPAATRRSSAASASRSRG
jgi:hypothetical protein